MIIETGIHELTDQPQSENLVEILDLHFLDTIFTADLKGLAVTLPDARWFNHLLTGQDQMSGQQYMEAEKAILEKMVLSCFSLAKNSTSMEDLRTVRVGTWVLKHHLKYDEEEIPHLLIAAHELMKTEAAKRLPPPSV